METLDQIAAELRNALQPLQCAVQYPEMLDDQSRDDLIKCVRRCVLVARHLDQWHLALSSGQDYHGILCPTQGAAVPECEQKS